MSTTTDGNLYYGIQLGESRPWTNEDLQYEDYDWEEYYAMKIGVKKPDAEYSDNTKHLYKEYWDNKHTLIKNSRCSIGIHCSFDYPLYYVCITKSKVTAPRGTPIVIKSLEIEDGWDDALKDFCKIMDIEYEQPHWWLSSLWG